MNIEEHPFIQSITPGEREPVISEIEILSLDKGKAIFNKEAKPEELYLILDGTVVFTLDKPDGSRQHVSESNAGEFFGEISLLTGDPRALDAYALSNVKLARVPKNTVDNIINKASGPTVRVLESLILHLKGTTSHYMNDILRTEKLALVGTMISSILHDFKNPFASISLGAYLIKSKHKGDPKLVKNCNNIEAQIQRMVEMANDLSAFSRGDREINFKQIDLEKLFTKYRELNEPFFDNPSLEVEFDIESGTIEGDEGKLLRVLQNLIGNSVEAVLSARNDGKINIKASTRGDDLLLTISDNGPGIPEQIQETFFEPFVTHGKSGGTGLGTAIAKSFIDAHKGSIEFKTGPNGTTFTIILPKKQSKM